jgi:MBG domain-containing protein
MSVPHASLLKPRRFFLLVALLFAIASSAFDVSAATTIRILKGSDQQTTYGAAFPAALVVWVTDPIAEQSLKGLRVDFAPSAGIGLSSSYAITDEYGLASVTATGLAACNSEVTAEVAGDPRTKTTFEGLVVNKAPLTVLPGDLKSLVGSPIPAATSYSFMGFVNGDTQETARITGIPNLTTTATDQSPHANYAIKGGVGSLSAPNYTFVPGFGTLAILELPEFDRSNSEDNGQEEASNDSPASENGPQVHTALVGQLESMTMVQPNFIAGLRGESGVFVRAAMWANPASSAANKQAILAQSATQNLPLAIATNLPTFVAGVRTDSDVPVRSVILPQAVTASAIAKNSDTRSAIQPVAVATFSNSRPGSAAPVRAAIMQRPSTVPAAQSSYTGSAIRKAFNPPGVK